MSSPSDHAPADVAGPATLEGGGAIVELPPPPFEVCQAVARMLIGVLARQAVADLGLRAVEGPKE